MVKPLDIFITAYLRSELTQKTLDYLRERTNYPHRVILINQGGNDHISYPGEFIRIDLSQNVGIHCAWNIALAMAESEYFITSDNDIFVPDLRNRIDNFSSVLSGDPNNTPDWLFRMVKVMDERPDYGAISLHPHVFIGAAGIDPNDPEDVKERNMCGAVMRIMRREAVEKAGGWEKKIEAGRNHEERTICSRLQTNGYKVGITSRIRAWHSFGKEVSDNGGGWGYPTSFPPEAQKHNPELKEYVKAFDNNEGYDLKTWLPK